MLESRVKEELDRVWGDLRHLGSFLLEAAG